MQNDDVVIQRAKQRARGRRGGYGARLPWDRTFEPPQYPLNQPADSPGRSHCAVAAVLRHLASLNAAQTNDIALNGQIVVIAAQPAQAGLLENRCGPLWLSWADPARHQPA